MQTTSDIYKRILARDDYIVRKKAVVNGVEYTDDTGLLSVSRVHRLYAGEGPGVGGAVAAEYQLMLHTDNILPRLSRIELFVCLEGGGDTSEWLPMGTGFSSTRYRDKIQGCWKVTGFDALLLAEQPYLDPEETPGEWPRSCQTVVEDIRQRLGLELDERTALGNYEVGYPGEQNMRSILCAIAAMHAANWTVTAAGKLYLVPLVPTGDRQDLSDHMATLLTGTEFAPFSRVRYLYDDEAVAEAGDGTGRTLEAECQWATQEMADAALAVVQGYVYRPYEAEQAVFDPAVELGDPVIVDGVESVMAALETDFDLLCTADISAPAEDAVESDFPFVNKPQAKMKSDIANNQAILWTGIELADHLSTSKKISKYLLGDTSEDDFVVIRGQSFRWIRARTDGSEEQLTDIDGRPLYWDPDVEKAEVGVDGHYYIGTEKVKPTIVETPYPVMCYAYEEQEIASWKFRSVRNPDGTTAFLPNITMGVGTDPTGETENGKFRITKHFTGADLEYQTSEGKIAGAFFRDDGFTDVTQRRAGVKVDTVNGVITVTPEGSLMEPYDIYVSENEDGSLDLTWPDLQTFHMEVV